MFASALVPPTLPVLWKVIGCPSGQRKWSPPGCFKSKMRTNSVNMVFFVLYDVI